MEESLSHTTERENVKKQCSPTILAPETSFVEDNFSMDQAYGGVVLGWFKHITFIVHFISILITSAPPENIRQ